MLSGTKEVIIEIKESAAPLPPLKYLDTYDDFKFQSLLKRLPEKVQYLSRREADSILTKKKLKFRANQVLNIGANSSNLLYSVFTINTSASGIKSFVKIFSSRPISDTGAAFLGIFSSLLNTLQWLLMYSAEEEAIKTVLADRSPKQDLKEFIDFARLHPASATLRFVQFLIDQTILLTVNLTSTSTELIYIVPMPYVPLWFEGIAIGVVLGLGNRFCNHCWTDNYYLGKDFWLNTEERPYLLGEISRGNIAIPLVAGLQGGVAVGLRTLQFYSIASATLSSFGGIWVPSYMAAAAAFLHSVHVTYPATFDFYMKPGEELNAILLSKLALPANQFIDRHLGQLKKISQMSEIEQKEFLDILKQDISTQLIKGNIPSSETSNPKIEQLAKQFIHFNINDPLEKIQKAFTYNLVKLNKTLLAEKIFKEKGRMRLIAHNPLCISELGLQTSVGGYIGYNAITPLLMPSIGIASLPLAIAAGSLALGGLFYTAEINRAINRLSYEELNPISEAESKHEISTAIHALAFGINTISQFADGMSVIGLLEEFVPEIPASMK